MIAKLYKTSIKIITSLSFSLGVISLASAIPVYATSTGSVGSWTTEANTLPVQTAESSSVMYNGRVYVLGGEYHSTNGFVYLNTVYSAPLNANGSVGAWTTEANALPSALTSATAVVNNGFIYVIGGFNGTSDVNTVYSAPLNANGSVGAWTTEANALPISLDGASSSVYSGHIYLMGGYSAANSSIVNTVYSAPLNANGSVGAWTTEANALPVQIYKATSLLNNGFVYVLGGISFGNVEISAVYSAPINANGSVGTWTTEANALPITLLAATSVAYNSHAYVLGGNSNSSSYAAGASTAVYSAPLNANGSVGAWTTEANALPVPIENATSVLYNGRAYILGGTNGFTWYNTVYSASLVPQSSGGSTSTTVLGVPDTGFSNLVTNAKETTIKSVIAVVAILSLAYLSRKRLKN